MPLFGESLPSPPYRVKSGHVCVCFLFGLAFLSTGLCQDITSRQFIITAAEPKVRERGGKYRGFVSIPLHILPRASGIG